MRASKVVVWRDVGVPTQDGPSWQEALGTLRRRERVVRVFPNDDSAYRLIGAVLADINDAWSERIYLNFGGLWDADLVAIDSDLISVAVA